MEKICRLTAFIVIIPVIFKIQMGMSGIKKYLRIRVHKLSESFISRISGGRSQSARIIMSNLIVAGTPSMEKRVFKDENMLAVVIVLF